ncbi:hypothetical protein LWF15_02050 [Kineosporia rhizophila]|uniref:RNA polymerase sigma factor n=1 Tax=Kineosporia rhizophila TaxID=84633 RepID=UPI001E3A9667|nr:hypothetical protein [Kineosporia rhizophila]MCE0534281.1 hypothetical protein [Kineosporia rhizophila]
MTTDTQAPAGRGLPDRQPRRFPGRIPGQTAGGAADQNPGRLPTRRPGRREDDWVSLFPELYRSAFTAAHRELGSRTAAEEVTHATLARAHAQWPRIGDSPVGWVSTAARTQARQVLQRQPLGREVLTDDETELLPGQIPDPAPGDLAAVTRRGRWLRRRRAAGWATAGASVVAAAILAVGLGNWMPPTRVGAAAVPAVAPVTSDYSPIDETAQASQAPNLLFGRISAGRSEQGSVRVTFEPATLASGQEQRWGSPQQLVIDPPASLESRQYAREGQPLIARTPEQLVQNLNRSTPGGQAEVWVRLGPDGRISALRER